VSKTVISIIFHIFYQWEKESIFQESPKMQKAARGSETAYENTRFVLPRERLTYIVTSTKRV
jgi:hypothetical protein